MDSAEWILIMSRYWEDINKKDIPNEDFECNPKGECWCKEIEFPKLRPNLSKEYLDMLNTDTCLSPDEVKRFQLPKSSPNTSE